MSPEVRRQIKARALHFLRFLGREKGLWLRALLCWFVGMTFLVVSQNLHYDLRFLIRGAQPVVQKIVIVDFSMSELARLQGDRYGAVYPLREPQITSDAFYWHEATWQKILGYLKGSDVKLGIIAFNFGENILLKNQSSVFRDPKFFWSVRLDGDSIPHPPPFVSSDQWGSWQVKFDNDSILRDFALQDLPSHNLIKRVVQRLEPGSRSAKLHFSKRTDLINFSGSNAPYRRVGFREILNGSVDETLFKDAIVILGEGSRENSEYLTPVGRLTRSEVIANIVDQTLSRKTIFRVKFWAGSLILLFILLISTWVMSNFPQFAAFIFLMWIGTAYTSVSLWVFDKFFIWTPIAAVWTQIGVTYILFLSFHLTLQEYQNWRLAQQKQYLMELEELKNNFVSLISHDLKTPIAKIHAICDRLLTESHTSPDKVEAFESIKKEGFHLLRSIQSILQITLIESQSFKIHKEAGDLNEVVETVIAELRPLAQAKGIHIGTELEPMFLIEMDLKMMKEVVLNLVENAIKYSPNDSVVRISTSEVDDKVLLVVEDQGPGVSRSEQKKIFEKFYRAKKQTQTQKGSGLGLYLVKYFVELHGGKVLIESREGSGTKIGFSLPLGLEPKMDDKNRIELVERKFHENKSDRESQYESHT